MHRPICSRFASIYLFTGGPPTSMLRAKTFPHPHHYHHRHHSQLPSHDSLCIFCVCVCVSVLFYHTHRLCDYMFELSSKFNRFYENCPVNTAETEELKRSRTALCSCTADVIQLGLGLLGIGTLDRL